MPYTADIKHPKLRAYSVRRFELCLGETVVIELAGADAALIRDWFSSQDRVLDIVISEDLKAATVKATAKGKCELQVQKQDRTAHLVIEIEVFDEVAASLNMTVGPAELKP